MTPDAWEMVRFFGGIIALFAFIELCNWLARRSEKD